MARSKKIFIAVAMLFFAGLGYLIYDISSRTTFPGSKLPLRESIEKQLIGPDSASQDSAKLIHR